ncbi:hypothetical protein JCM9279_004267 [Rhodotorula babjevae]
MAQSQSGTSHSGESTSTQQPTLDVEALAKPPDTLAFYGSAVRDFFAAALDETGATANDLLPQLDDLVDIISERLLAARDEHEMLCYYLLGLDEAVSPRLTGETLANWTRRMREAGGDVIDEDEDEAEQEDSESGESRGTDGEGERVLPEAEQ